MNQSDAKSFGVDMLERSYGKWWLMLLDGLCYIALCVLSIIYGSQALTLFVLIFGIYRGLMGALAIISALIIRSKYGSSVSFGIARGILDLLIAVLFLTNPSFVIKFIVFIIGMWGIISGIILLIASGRSGSAAKIVKIVIGILLIAFGIFAFVNPIGLANFFMMIIGLFLGVSGIFLVVQSINMKKNDSRIKHEKQGYDDYKIE